MIRTTSARVRLVVTALSAIAIAIAIAPAADGAGWGFEPTALDWQAWPQYCRVQYSWVNRGANEFGNYYPDSEIASWRATIGTTTFESLHHYCKALIVLRQARLEHDPHVRKFKISLAVDDGVYSYERADPRSIVYPAVAALMGEARFANGEPDAAIAILRRAIEAQPERFEAYATLAKIYREQHQLARALAVVNEANEATHGESAEIEYSLGLLNLEAGNVDAAVKNAREAYARDYPLPGLRTKLEKLGRWPEQPETSQK